MPNMRLTPADIDRLFALQDSSDVFEDIIRLVFEARVARGDIVVDGGANLGLHTYALAERVGPDGHVWAYEPIPQVAARLKQRCLQKQLSQVDVVEAALSNESGSGEFLWIKAGDGYSGLKPRDYPAGLADSTERLTVAKVKLDDQIASGPSCRFIKLDLEGGEYDALQGAEGILGRLRPLVITEYTSRSAHYYGYQPAAFFALFASLDYRLYDLFGREMSSIAGAGVRFPWYVIGVASDSEDERFMKQDFLPLLKERILKGDSG